MQQPSSLHTPTSPQSSIFKRELPHLHTKKDKPNEDADMIDNTQLRSETNVVADLTSSKLLLIDNAGTISSSPLQDAKENQRPLPARTNQGQQPGHSLRTLWTTGMLPQIGAKDEDDVVIQMSE